jgi:putative tryptophan/tyrosine transport system substrate-binding protein
VRPRSAAVTVALMIAVWALPAAGAARRVGVLSLDAPGGSAEREALVETLRELGSTAGHTLVVESRFADGRRERLPELAADLVRLNVDVIVAERGQATRAAQAATTTVPVVMVASSDPVATGIVAELARPGANVTGVTLASPAVSGKRLELLRELVPRATRVAVLLNDSDPGKIRELGLLRQASGTLRQVLEPVSLRDAAGLPGALLALERARPDALIVLADPVTLAQRRPLADFAASRRLPTMYELAAFVEAGGLIAYGPNLNDVYRRAAVIVDKIFRGTKPADIPVEEPTTFDLTLSARAARALGLVVPQGIAVRATRIVE